MNYAAHIAEQLNLGQRQVEKTIELLEQGATVPFIARYRKEATGSLNEVQIAAIRDMLAKLKELDKRREAILASINEQGKLDTEAIFVQSGTDGGQVCQPRQGGEQRGGGFGWGTRHHC